MNGEGDLSHENKTPMDQIICWSTFSQTEQAIKEIFTFISSANIELNGKPAIGNQTLAVMGRTWALYVMQQTIGVRALSKNLLVLE